MGVDRYRSLRRPGLTPEPVPAEQSGARTDHTGDDQDGRGDTFVVQEHHATALHWDFRLERDGVLVSWAVPKGMPLDPKANRLAKQTEDHPLAYATFTGGIPKGEYGGGAVAVWDHGTYRLEKWRNDEVKVVLAGGRVSGRYVLFRTGARDWMVHRMDPSPPGWTPLPADLAPMRARPGRRLPRAAQDWSFEVDWAGLRIMIAVDGGRLRVVADNALLTPRFPELRGLGLQLGSRQVLLDGALVVLDGGGVPDPARLHARAEAVRPGVALRRDAPVQLMIGDVLHLEGRGLLEVPQRERRAILDRLELGGEHWRVPPAIAGDGRDLLGTARARGLPGVLAKRRDSPYRPGVEHDDWRAIG